MYTAYHWSKTLTLYHVASAVKADVTMSQMKGVLFWHTVCVLFIDMNQCNWKTASTKARVEKLDTTSQGLTPQQKK